MSKCLELGTNQCKELYYSFLSKLAMMNSKQVLKEISTLWKFKKSMEGNQTIYCYYYEIMIMNLKYSSTMYLKIPQSNRYLVGILLFHFPILRKVHAGIPNITFVDHSLVTKLLGVI